MHHYFVAAVLIPWTGYFNPISTALQALLAGIFVEGNLVDSREQNPAEFHFIVSSRLVAHVELDPIRNKQMVLHLVVQEHQT